MFLDVGKVSELGLKGFRARNDFKARNGFVAKL